MISRQKTANEKFEQEARSFCYERIMARGLPMKLVRAEATLDKKRVVFYFTADGRIDFRELVKDLAARFKTRIEMRQIGVRDKAKACRRLRSVRQGGCVARSFSPHSNPFRSRWQNSRT